MPNEKFDEMVKYARSKEENWFAPMVKLICADCDSPLVMSGLTRDEVTAIIECTGCGLAYQVPHEPQPSNLTEDGTTVRDPSKPLSRADIARSVLMSSTAKDILPKGLIEWALEKGRLEAEIFVPRPGANLEALEAQYREWLKNNPKPTR